MSEPDWNTVCPECGYSSVDLEHMTWDRDQCLKRANKATALASQYLRERDALRDAMQDFLRDWDNGPEDRGTEGKLVDIAAKHADAFRHALNREE
jgi:hypothetical protein